MTLQEKLQSKLQPHTDRIKDGSNDEFDYLPAVLQHLIEEQKQQTRTTAELVNLVRGDVKSGVDSIRDDVKSGVHSIRDDVKSGVSLITDDVKTGVSSIRDDVKSGVDSIRDDVKSGVDSIRDDVKSGVSLITDHVKTGVSSIRDDVKSGVSSIRDDVKSGADAITGYLTELKTAMAKESQKTQRFLLAGLIFGMVTLAGVVTIAVLLYVRH